LILFAPLIEQATERAVYRVHFLLFKSPGRHGVFMVLHKLTADALESVEGTIAVAFEPKQDQGEPSNKSRIKTRQTLQLEFIYTS
jgi:hypothetical protein